MDECFLESLLDNVFGVFPNTCVAERKHKNLALVALNERLKRQFIATLCGSDEFFVCSGITGGSNGSFANLVSKLTQHDASPVQWAHALEPVRLPLLKLRANHSPNPGLRKSLIFGGNIGLEVEEVGKVENVQPTSKTTSSGVAAAGESWLSTPGTA
jgi:hypothetical protein